MSFTSITVESGARANATTATTAPPTRLFQVLGPTSNRLVRFRMASTVAAMAMTAIARISPPMPNGPSKR